MFLRWLSTKIAQTVPLRWTRWPPELKIEKPLNDFSSLTSELILKIFYRKVSWVTLYQNCSNRSTPLNKMATRAKNRKTFKWLLLLNQKMDFEIIIENRFWNPAVKSCIKCNLRPLVQRFQRKRLLLLNQKMDFEIIIQEWFLGDPLPKLLKLFPYVEQNGHQGYK